MTISFNGLSNIKVLKSEKQGMGMLLGVNNEIKSGQLNITEVKLRFNLINDTAGRDMDELKAALNKARRGYSYNPQTPDTVELHLKKVNCDDGAVPVSRSLLSLNNQDINITKREDLSLYTYLAQLTKRIFKHPEMSPEQKKYINLIRRAIKENAMYYIDFVM